MLARAKSKLDDLNESNITLVQSAGRTEWVDAARLNSDPAYQRPLSEPHINRIVSGFDPNLFGVLWVSERQDRSLWVIDGQHRLEALRRMGWGDQRVQCLISSGLSPAEEAWVFSQTQRGRKQLGPQDVFRGDLAAGDPDAHAIKAAVEAAGFSLGLRGGDRSGGKIAAVGALRFVWKQYHRDVLTDTLALIRDGWGTEHGPSKVVIQGFAAFMARYQDIYTRSHAVRVLQKTSETTMEALAQDQERVNDAAPMVAAGRALWFAYNRGLRNRLPEWTERHSTRTIRTQ